MYCTVKSKVKCFQKILKGRVEEKQTSPLGTLLSEVIKPSVFPVWKSCPQCSEQYVFIFSLLHQITMKKKISVNCCEQAKVPS